MWPDLAVQHCTTMEDGTSRAACTETRSAGAGLGWNATWGTAPLSARLWRDRPPVQGGAVRHVVFESDDTACSREIAGARDDRVLAAAVDCGVGHRIGLARELEGEGQGALRIASGAGLIAVEVKATGEVLGAGRLERRARRGCAEGREHGDEHGAHEQGAFDRDP